MREYEVRIRFQGSVSTVRVSARDSSQAKALVQNSIWKSGYGIAGKTSQMNFAEHLEYEIESLF